MFVRALESIGQSLTSSLDLNETLDTIVDRALEVMAADAALVVSWDGVASEFSVLRAAGRLSGEYAGAGSIPVGGGPMSRAILNGVAVTTPDILHDPETWLVPARRAQIEREGFRAVGAAPRWCSSGRPTPPSAACGCRPPAWSPACPRCACRARCPSARASWAAWPRRGPRSTWPTCRATRARSPASGRGRPASRG